MSRRPAVVAFDVIETLMSLEPLRARLTDIGQPPGLLEAWYTRTLRDGMALSATGDYARFTDVAEAALRALTHFTISEEQVAAVMAGFGELPAFPDAVPAITSLAEAGLRVACLTNGPASLTSSFIDRAGLTTGWVSRKSGGFGAPFAAPDVAGEDLTEVAARLLALEPS